MVQIRLYEMTSKILSKLSRLIVVGDIHGDYEIFQRICNLFNPLKDCMIFLGDYADRGPRGIEVLHEISKLVKKYDQIIILKGNHEDYTIDGKPKFSPCDLIEEANKKKGGWKRYFQNELRYLMDEMYLAALLPNQVLFVHGGISSKIKNITDLRYPSKHIEEDILWSDPRDGKGEYPNTRGIGVSFGKDISDYVCSNLGVKTIIRSHQPMKARKKPYVEHDGRVITINSTSIYGSPPFILCLPLNTVNATLSHLEEYTLEI